MPLHAVDGPARDESFEISFTMTDGVRPVRCTVQQGALDAVESGPALTGADRLARFERHRAAFEVVASSLYDAGLPLRITRDHLSQLRAFASGGRPEPGD